MTPQGVIDADHSLPTHFHVLKLPALGNTLSVGVPYIHCAPAIPRLDAASTTCFHPVRQIVLFPVISYPVPQIPGVAAARFAEQRTESVPLFAPIHCRVTGFCPVGNVSLEEIPLLHWSRAVVYRISLAAKVRPFASPHLPSTLCQLVVITLHHSEYCPYSLYVGSQRIVSPLAI